MKWIQEYSRDLKADILCFGERRKVDDSLTAIVVFKTTMEPAQSRIFLQCHLSRVQRGQLRMSPQSTAQSTDLRF